MEVGNEIFSVSKVNIKHMLDDGKIGMWEIWFPSGKMILRGQSCIHALFGLELERLDLTWDSYLENYCHPEEVERVRETMHAALIRSDALSLEHRVFNKSSQEWLWTYLFGRAKIYPQGNQVYICGGIQDLHNKRAFQQALQATREADERAQIMLDATPLCCNFWDEDHQNIDCNQEASKLFGLSSKEEYLERFTELSPEYQPCGMLSSELADKKVSSAFISGREVFEWMHQKPNGDPIPAEITLVRVKRGNAYIVAGYTRDLRELKKTMTEMHEAEREMRIARDQAERSAQAKSDFLANMSHEIRTPMNAILGMTHLLLRSDIDQKQRYHLTKTEQATKSLLRIIGDILDFSKIEAGRMEIEHEPFLFEAVLRDLTDMTLAATSTKNIELLMYIDADVPETMLGDSLRLHQVLLNLVGNSIKFTSSGIITLSVAVAEKTETDVLLKFAVTDTGIGMSENHVAGLFSPFSQADTSTTRKYGGTGLGLAICKNLVGLMHGQIRCRSELGRGSTFTFTGRFDLPSVTDSIIPMKSHSLRNINVLLLGDSVNQIGTIRVNLQVLRCHIEQDSIGVSACDLDFSPEIMDTIDIIIADWNDPLRDAEIVLKKLNERSISLPLLVIIPPWFEENEHQLPDGAAALEAPVNLSSLYDAIMESTSGNSRSADFSDGVEYQNNQLDFFPPELRGKRILLAEDNEMNQILAVELLTMEGFEVDVASNGFEAIQLLEYGSYDLVLMDIQMPKMDGLTAVRHIRQVMKIHDLPILAMTAHAMQGDKDLSIKAGMNDHITKPIDPKLLYASLAKWLRANLKAD